MDLKTRGREKREVDGKKYLFCLLKTSPGLVIGSNLQKSIMKPLASIAGDFLELEIQGKLNAKTFSEAIREYMVHRNKTNELIKYLGALSEASEDIKELMSSVREVNPDGTDSEIDYDEYWDIDHHFINVLIEAFNHNFYKFFFLNIDLLLSEGNEKKAM